MEILHIVILVYILGAILTYIFLYGFYVRKYSKERSMLKFDYWIDDKYEKIFLTSIAWYIVIPLCILWLPIKIITNLIEKYYKVR